MGLEELSDTRSTRRTRSSTKGSEQTPVTPPTPKAETPSSSRRGKKKAVDVDQEEVIVNEAVKVSPKQPAPPRKRQKLADTIDGQNESKSEDKLDETDASSQDANGLAETMAVDEEVPTSEKKQVIEPIPEETSKEVAAETGTKGVSDANASQTAQPEALKKTPGSDISEHVEAMEVDSVKPASQSTAQPPFEAVSEKKESPPAIVISEPESDVGTVVLESKGTAAEPEITSTSEKSVTSQEAENEAAQVNTTVDVETSKEASVPEVTSMNHVEPTQVFEISSDNASHTIDSEPTAVAKVAPIEKIIEQSKIETTQGESVKS